MPQAAEEPPWPSDLAARSTARAAADASAAPAALSPSDRGGRRDLRTKRAPPKALWATHQSQRQEVTPPARLGPLVVPGWRPSIAWPPPRFLPLPETALEVAHSPPRLCSPCRGCMRGIGCSPDASETRERRPQVAAACACVSSSPPPTLRRSTHSHERSARARAAPGRPAGLKAGCARSGYRPGARQPAGRTARPWYAVTCSQGAMRLDHRRLLLLLPPRVAIWAPPWAASTPWARRACHAESWLQSRPPAFRVHRREL